MSKNEQLLKQIYEAGIIPVIKIDELNDTIPLIEALKSGGLNTAEITFRTAAAKDAIKIVNEKFPAVILGAGTILNVEQAKQAIEAGAKFIVSPGFSQKVVQFCLDQEVPIFPGVATPTDIQMAIEHGLGIVKFFPADAFGGIKTLKALAGPFGSIKFIPTGGITAQNLAEYIVFPKVFACGGSWMVKDELIKAKKFDEIKRLTEEAINIMLGFEVAHIGINMPDGAISLELTKRISKIFNFPIKEGNSSNFAGKAIEINKAKGLGANGHIAIATNSIDRALSHLNKSGVEIDMSTAKKDAAGNFVAVYLKGEYGSFAVHLLQKK
jgi:2-dehydro-3-deoxyphosphogluconate aldolase/(4S)-4-hydroxy-2-oxoglutarate aldolase